MKEKYYKHLKKRYDSAIETFDISKKRHYAERLFRITGDEKYIKYIREYYVDKKTEFNYLLDIVDTTHKQEEYGLKLIDNLAKGAWSKEERFKRRVPIYKKNPEFKYYYELSWFISKLQDHNVLSWFDSNKIENAINLLKNINFDTYFSNEDLMFVDPVQTMNCIYNLKFIIDKDYSKATIELVDQLYSNDTSEVDFIQKLYFYTHVFIADTKYYQRKLRGYEFIFEYFKDNLERILKVDTADIIAEVGVCCKYKLENIDSSLISKIEIEIMKRIDEGGGILTYKDPKSEREDVSKVEHRNVLAIILLSDFNNIFKGPNL